MDGFIVLVERTLKTDLSHDSFDSPDIDKRSQIEEEFFNVIQKLSMTKLVVLPTTLRFSAESTFRQHFAGKRWFAKSQIEGAEAGLRVHLK
jgi:hypothetical protein